MRVAAACSWAQFAMPLSGHPGRRPGIHVLAALSAVRWDLQHDRGRVDFRLRGNDNNEGGGTPRKWPDIGRLHDLGWAAKIPFREGLAETYR